MKRKTNLFYTSGPDSKFITFSNYTEALTGNFLSINSKLFPNRFLCLKINGLNKETKATFIQGAAAYYENKLAALRDSLIQGGDNIEHVKPLGYLLEYILHSVKRNEDGEWVLKDANESGIIFDNTSTLPDTIENLITFVGDVTEFDYNGTYTDIICNVSMSSYKYGVISTITKDLVGNKTCTVSESTLYGWDKDKDFIFEGYENMKGIYDSPQTYMLDTPVDHIDIVNVNDYTYDKTVEFNVIIPLFSYINSADTDNMDLSELLTLDMRNSMAAIVDVPLGMWMYADDEKDTFIELKKDADLNAYPSWSLLISSQFKPFPYSNKLVQENSTSESALNAYSTFAEVLTRINDVLDKFNSINVNIGSLSNRLAVIEAQLNNIATEANIEGMRKIMTGIETDLKKDIEDLNKRITDLKWSNVG